MLPTVSQNNVIASEAKQSQECKKQEQEFKMTRQILKMNLRVAFIDLHFKL